MNKKTLLAAGAVSLALLTATPALADSDRKGGEDNENRFGLKLQLLGNRDHDKDDDKDHRKSHNDDNEKNKGENSNEFHVTGTVTAISGTTLTVAGNNGTVYTVNAGNAKFGNSSRFDITLSDVRLNDTVKVRGTLNGTTVVATKIHDKSATQREFVERFGNITAGTVTAIGGSTFVIDPAGAKSTATVTTDAATTFKVNGKTGSSSDVKVGSTVFVVGTTTASSTDNSLITASVVHVWDKTIGWLKHFLGR